jgi:hypothetical protein
MRVESRYVGDGVGYAGWVLNGIFDENFENIDRFFA